MDSNIPVGAKPLNSYFFRIPERLSKSGKDAIIICFLLTNPLTNQVDRDYIFSFF
jgi:hypothetical protein